MKSKFDLYLKFQSRKVALTVLNTPHMPTGKNLNNLWDANFRHYLLWLPLLTHTSSSSFPVSNAVYPVQIHSQDCLLATWKSRAWGSVFRVLKSECCSVSYRPLHRSIPPTKLMISRLLEDVCARVSTVMNARAFSSFVPMTPLFFITGNEVSSSQIMILTATPSSAFLFSSSPSFIPLACGISVSKSLTCVLRTWLPVFHAHWKQTVYQVLRLDLCTVKAKDTNQ
ncbi:hypothetical protein M8C21_006841 [Ambrosia artemisiifolia]|uniref:Uncharacterized protein n=1 Tax=Ambrosia artemisiifolia TaxID=4212 RepID=A0AAD5D5R0_AMBAR|nr:hypothetical protein M8C21_006841 [Ambrosia artemisiifolia]